ncbi:MmcQ/YjbR family DNA-binding protein [Microbacterium sp. B35-30]|uniref:MmcQ/YjbR family DNA-binding protein n=1 Tax=Microbacterium sp. B35-30 TaxID=1962642 RepID=UPI001953126B|nr:MmcQ/YjbR family DNA-binding protein [Microbacterium sp. B35-30]
MNGDAASTHPMWFLPDHPLVVRVRGLCMPYPEAVEAISHGRCTFRAGKRQFAIVGVAAEPAVLFVPDDLERPVLLESDDVFVPPYEGAYGWLALRIEPEAGDWELLGELLDTSYRLVALQRQLRALDARDA